MIALRVILMRIIRMISGGLQHALSPRVESAELKNAENDS
jgi:hypothetical protein